MELAWAYGQYRFLEPAHRVVGCLLRVECESGREGARERVTILGWRARKSSGLGVWSDAQLTLANRSKRARLRVTPKQRKPVPPPTAGL